MWVFTILITTHFEPNILEHETNASDANEQNMSEEEPIYHLRPSDLR